jgi:hypothetical protein
VAEITPCALCDSPTTDGRCSARDCLRGEFTPAQAAEYRQYCASPTGTARKLVEANETIATLKKAAESRERVLSMLIEWSESAYAELTKMVPWDSEFPGLSDLADEARSFLASLFDSYDFKVLRVERGRRERLEAAETKCAAYETQIASLRTLLTEASMRIATAVDDAQKAVAGLEAERKETARLVALLAEALPWIEAETISLKDAIPYDECIEKIKAAIASHKERT